MVKIAARWEFLPSLTNTPAELGSGAGGRKIKSESYQILRRRVSITPLASIARTIELGSGTLARRNPMRSTSSDGEALLYRYVEAK
jgi:hypothetical protein